VITSTAPSAPPASAAPTNTTAVRGNPPTSSAPNAGAANSISVNAGTEIGNVIETYARAIESRDMGQLRRVYSTITGDQASAFADFFSSTRALRAVLAVKSLQVDGDRATAHVSGTYEFTTTAGRAQRQPVTFQAEFRHDGGSWKLVAVR
jgi:ketosteroid isomerase-like protein